MTLSRRNLFRTGLVGTAARRRCQNRFVKKLGFNQGVRNCRMLQCRRVAVAKFGEQRIVPVVMQSQSLNRPNVPQPPIRPGRPNPQRFNLCPEVTEIKVVALAPEIRGFTSRTNPRNFPKGFASGVASNASRRASSLCLDHQSKVFGSGSPMHFLGSTFTCHVRIKAGNPAEQSKNTTPIDSTGAGTVSPSVSMSTIRCRAAA